VLADFANSTGDPVFDDTLKQAVAVDLEQSPFLNILSDRAMAEALRLMGRRPGDKLAQDLAREVCQRVGSKAVLGGSIANLGSQYVIGLKAVNCETGDTLVEQQTRAKGKDELLKQLDKAASELRSKLGESLGSIRKFDIPLEQATTPSFEALKAYSLGRKAFSEEGEAAAIPFFRHAIEFDPNFALAYAALGNSEFNLLETRLATEDIQKAWELRDRVTEREKFRISAFYYTFVTEELEMANQTYELWARTYPRDDAPHLYWGLSYAFVGKYEKAAAETLEDLRLNPIDGLGYGNLMSYYVYLNRLDEAKDTYERALLRNIDTLILRSKRYALAFLQKDVAEMERQVTWALGKPGVEDFLFSFQSDTEAFSGRLGKAREFSRRAVESAQRHGRKETAADWQTNAAPARGRVRQYETRPAGDHRGTDFSLNPGRANRCGSGIGAGRGFGPSAESGRRASRTFPAEFRAHQLLAARGPCGR
jgi:tetratricopeptide (TPR) repeat protein